jgi:hypothetical protein
MSVPQHEKTVPGKKQSRVPGRKGGPGSNLAPPSHSYRHDNGPFGNKVGRFFLTPGFIAGGGGAFSELQIQVSRDDATTRRKPNPANRS